MTITKKTVNGKEEITACSLKNCCLIGTLEGDNIKLTNEKNEVLTCSIKELEELFFHLQSIGVANYAGIST
jgi:hypothetical protein